MNYTEWLIESFPKLAEASSAETFTLISQAKLTTRFHRVLIDIVLTVMIILGFNYISLFALDTSVDSYVYWVSLILVLTISRYCSEYISQNIVKKKLTVFISEKYAI
jgi:hypothetical protein